MTYRLVIGNKALSSWSLRPWLAMRHSDIPFREISIALRTPETRTEILGYSPSGHVPALLLTDGQVVWESLAILEYLAEAHPEAGLWPKAAAARAHARSVAAEMHAGFAALREHCPMHIGRRSPLPVLPEAVTADVRRIVALIGNCRRRFAVEGPLLFGTFTAADAMYAPVATRFATYVPDLRPYGDDGTAASYVAAVLALPAMAAWTADAQREPSPR
jgi:glutathione S-transferase